ncbi:hypothetical protein [Roseateles sp.]|uniref:hypothetical protein n=1 Tax=Roseateles sp. TaxID=1971397 RepID=UPI0032652A4F
MPDIRVKLASTSASTLACLALLAAAPAPALAATGAARASAAVVEAVPINTWLGLAVSVQDLLRAQQAPAGPATGALVPRVPTGNPPSSMRLLPAWFAAALDAKSSFAIDIVPSAGSALLPRGMAAAVSAFAAATGGDGDAPLVITVAFN